MMSLKIDETLQLWVRKAAEGKNLDDEHRAPSSEGRPPPCVQGALLMEDIWGYLICAIGVQLTYRRMADQPLFWINTELSRNLLLLSCSDENGLKRIQH
jgi:hypothetical protein